MDTTTRSDSGDGAAPRGEIRIYEEQAGPYLAGGVWGFAGPVEAVRVEILVDDAILAEFRRLVAAMRPGQEAGYAAIAGTIPFRVHAVENPGVAAGG
jgi:hypothetical protein